MGEFIESAASILSLAQRRVELSAQNIANATTPGYKRRVGFEQFLNNTIQLSPETASLQTSTDFSLGKQTTTNTPSDLAIAGQGFFVVEGPAGPLYTRNGQFKRDADGQLTTEQGFPVQIQGGGGLALKAGAFEVASDGAVLQGGQPVGKLAIVEFTDTSLVGYGEAGMLTTPVDNVSAARTATVRQGVLETSNVSTGDEMVAIMEALRRAESGQRLVNVYDDLMGRALAAFGQA